MNRKTVNDTGVHPRNDNVLVRMQKKIQREDGIIFPDVSQEGQEYVVLECGPDVSADTLEPGDKILMIGQRGVDWDFLPGQRDLFVIKETKVVLRYEG